MLRRVLCALLLSLAPLVAQAASLSLAPAGGTFTVGSTFDVSLALNSEEQTVNAVGAFIQFPPDKLQLVSPSVGKSVVGVWVAAPQFNNQTGEIRLEGVMPGGLKTSNGLLTTLTFRVKSVGTAGLKFSDQSRVLLNDGVGTDVLNKLQGGIYTLVLPPPAGPLVVSETHPDQTKWYRNNNPVLSWSADKQAVTGYSYVLNTEPVDIPDDISEGGRQTVSYRGVSDGHQYFHIKALRDGVWGETTHYGVQIDQTPPALFSAEILPSARTSRRQPVFQFATTDAASGLDHYELKLVPLSANTNGGVSGSSQPLFIESTSPYVAQPLELGDYDVIVRAYDVAGNYQETITRLSVVTTVFDLVSDRGLVIKGWLEVSWPWVWGLLGLLVLVLALVAYKLRRSHRHLGQASTQAELTPQLNAQLEELKRYRERYGKVLVWLLVTSLTFYTGAVSVRAAESLPPPVVSTISRHISNRDIFYIGGTSEVANGEVIIYLQNPATGELWSYQTQTDSHGDWFYRHDHLLSAGAYLLWVQARQGELQSPTGPQLGLAVESQALQFGASRLSYETVYLIVMISLFLGIILLVGDVIVHARRVRRQKRQRQEEIRGAQESVRRGFAVLRRDLMHELKSEKEHNARERLLADLARVEKYIGKEVWDIEQVEYNT